MTVAAASPLEQLGLRGAGDVNRLLRAHRFPFARGGWFVFLHHDPERRLKSVRLLHGLRGHRHPPLFEERAPGVHVLALRAEGVTRMEYRLALEDENGRRDVNDPLNPYTVAGPFGAASVAMGPGYAAPTYARPPAPEDRGRLSLVRAPVALDHRGRRRVSDAWIWDPPGTQRDEPLPLLLVLDGTDYLRFSALREALENLLGEGAIGRGRAVFLPPVHRNREYSANPHLPELVLAFVPEALAAADVPVDVPLLGVGASLGGLALLHAHATRPGRLAGLVLQSGSFFSRATDAFESGFAHFDRVTGFVEPLLAGETAIAPVPIHLTCGAGGENLDNNRAMLAALRRQGVPAELALVADAHNWTAWRDCIGPGLARLLPPR